MYGFGGEDWICSLSSGGNCERMEMSGSIAVLENVDLACPIPGF